MDPLTWIAHLPGPQFLLFYWILAIVVVVACTVWSRRLDPLPPMVQIPTHPDARTDPYEVAWLRDGARGMLTTALFTLRQRGAVGFDGERVQRTGPRPENPVEQAVYDALVVSRSGSELLGDGSIRAALDRIGQHFHDRYVRAGLVTTPSERGRARTAMLVGLGVMLGVAGFKLFVALSAGRTNVGFLIVSATVVGVALLLICRPRRLNARGKAHLSALVGNYREWGRSAVQASTQDAMLPLYVGMLGTGILVGSPYDDVNRTINGASSSGSSGGCGSGSSCSSGDGGGGGCGGGGCGGCGGGD